MLRALRLKHIAVGLTIAALMSGCSRSNVIFVDDGAAYTPESALALPETLDPGKLADEPSARSQELRHEALVDLRGMGAEAGEAAELITATFASDTQGVPFYVERARYDSQDVIVLVEAIGPPDGSLQDERVWVLDVDGEVLISGTR